MDLIDRAAVLAKFNDTNIDVWQSLTDEETSKRFWLFCQVADALDDIPIIPAVPLEPLCEWLSGHAGRPMDCVGHLCGKCEFDGVGVGQEKCWENLIRKWMEEQHDAE